MNDWMMAVLPPVGLAAAGWILYVERRLGKIDVLNEKLDLLIEHIVPETEAGFVYKTRRRADKQSD